MIICAGENESFAFAKSVGVGLVNSAINLTKLCSQEIVKSLVFIGSAGAYKADMPVLSLFVSHCATNIELGFLAGHSYTPLDNRIGLPSLHIDKQIQQLNVSCETPIQSSIVNSSNYITTNQSLAARYVNAGILLENMEFFTIMSVAKHFQIPCVGVFCVSNHCDENAHKHFMENQKHIQDIFNQHKHIIKDLSYALEIDSEEKHNV